MYISLVSRHYRQGSKIDEMFIMQLFRIIIEAIRHEIIQGCRELSVHFTEARIICDLVRYDQYRYAMRKMSYTETLKATGVLHNLNILEYGTDLRILKNKYLEPQSAIKYEN